MSARLVCPQHRQSGNHILSLGLRCPMTISVPFQILHLDFVISSALVASHTHSPLWLFPRLRSLPGRSEYPRSWNGSDSIYQAICPIPSIYLLRQLLYRIEWYLSRGQSKCVLICPKSLSIRCP